MRTHRRQPRNRQQGAFPDRKGHSGGTCLCDSSYPHKQSSKIQPDKSCATGQHRDEKKHKYCVVVWVVKVAQSSGSGIRQLGVGPLEPLAGCTIGG